MKTQVWIYTIESEYSVSAEVLLFTTEAEMQERFIRDILQDERDVHPKGANLGRLRGLQQAGAPVSVRFGVAREIYELIQQDGDQMPIYSGYGEDPREIEVNVEAITAFGEHVLDLLDANDNQPPGYIDSDALARHAISMRLGTDEPDGFFKRIAAPGQPDWETGRIIVMSTSHLTAEANEQLDDSEATSDRTRDLSELWRGVTIDPSERGYFITILHDRDDDEDDDETPECIRAIRDFARTHGFTHVRLDGDGPEVPGLPTYSWDVTEKHQE